MSTLIIDISPDSSVTVVASQGRFHVAIMTGSLWSTPVVEAQHLTPSEAVAFLAGALASESQLVQFLDWAEMGDQPFRRIFGRYPNR